MNWNEIEKTRSRLAQESVPVHHEDEAVLTLSSLSNDVLMYEHRHLSVKEHEGSHFLSNDFGFETNKLREITTLSHNIPGETSQSKKLAFHRSVHRPLDQDLFFQDYHFQNNQTDDIAKISEDISTFLVDEVPLYEPASHHEVGSESNVASKNDGFHQNHMEIIGMISCKASEKNEKKIRPEGIIEFGGFSAPGVVKVAQDGAESTISINKGRRKSVQFVECNRAIDPVLATEPNEDLGPTFNSEEHASSTNLHDMVARKLRKNSRVMQIIDGGAGPISRWCEKQGIFEDPEVDQELCVESQVEGTSTTEDDRHLTDAGIWDGCTDLWDAYNNRYIESATNHNDSELNAPYNGSKYREWNLYSTLFIGVITLMILASFVLTSAKSSASATVLKDYRDALSIVTDPSLFTSVEESPQAQALDWLLTKDKLRLVPQSDNLAQRYALMVLYFAASRGTWEFDFVDWESDGGARRVHECDWDFVYCKEGQVVRLEIEGQLGRGPLPSEIGALTQLETLRLTSMFLDGSLPETLGRLTDLKTLDLSHNEFRGSIPPTLYGLPSLEHLTLSHNQFDGALSEKIEELQKLQLIDLQDNMLVGRVPKGIESLQKLDFIHLDDNLFSGEILMDMNYLMSRVEVTMSNNFLTGELPSFAFEHERKLNSENTTLLNRDVRIERINLASNRLRGSISSGFGQMSTLRQLEISNNLLTGTILDFGNISSLETIDLSSNKLVGFIPRSMPPNLKVLKLQENQIISEMPSEIGNLNKLEVLNLRNTFLKGTIPTQLGLLTNLGELRLGFNSHIGEIPSEIGNLGEHLVFLDIEGNSLEGEIPPQLGGLDKLTKLHLSRNDLSGTIPSALGQLKNLVELKLEKNQLTGMVPTEMEDLKHMQMFTVYENEIGSFPESVCQLMDSGVLAHFLVDCGLDCSCCDQCPLSLCDENDLC